MKVPFRDRKEIVTVGFCHGWNMPGNDTGVVDWRQNSHKIGCELMLPGYVKAHGSTLYIFGEVFLLRT